MAYGTANVDVIQSSTANVPVQFNDGNGTQIGTLCRAWVNWDGQTSPNTAVRSSYNVSSITYTSTGYWIVNLTNALPDTKCSCVATSAYTNLGTTNAADVANANMVTTSTVAYTNTVINAVLGGTSRNPAVCQLSVFR